MKKSILLVAMLSLTVTVFAQNKGKDLFNIEHNWAKMIGYSYQPGYPYGFSLAGGSFMSVGFGDGKEFEITTNKEKREPTWSMRFGWIGYNFDEDVTGWGAVSFRPMLVLGFNKAKDKIFDAATNTWESESNTYFTMAPSLVVNLWMVHFSVGYEIVPKFKELNGLNFGVGFSVPLNPEKWEQKAKTYQENRNNKKSSSSTKYTKSKRQ